MNPRSWDEAFAVLEPLATDDYIGGAWPPIRKDKLRAFFLLAGAADGKGVVVELGTYRGLGAIALALGTGHNPHIDVHTFDDYRERVDHVGVRYDISNYKVMLANKARAGVPFLHHMGDVREQGAIWTRPVSLLVWDLGTDTLMGDLAAWLPHVIPGGLIAVKDLEDGGFGSAQLAHVPGLVLDREMGCVKVYRKTTATALWVVNDAYVDEALRSAGSVRMQMPELATTVRFASQWKHTAWFVEATRLLVEALDSLPDGEKVLFLDSDTYMVEPVPELFEMLDRFDLCLAHAPGHRTAPTVQPVPDSFPEFNIGVIAMRNNGDVRNLWRRVYWQQCEHEDVYGNNDQAALREVLWQQPHTVDYAVLPAEYNCRFNFGCQVRDRVKILHGRPLGGRSYAEIAASLNAGYAAGYELPPRLWHPQTLAGESKTKEEK